MTRPTLRWTFPPKRPYRLSLSPYCLAAVHHHCCCGLDNASWSSSSPRHYPRHIKYNIKQKVRRRIALCSPILLSRCSVGLCAKRPNHKNDIYDNDKDMLVLVMVGRRANTEIVRPQFVNLTYDIVIRLQFNIYYLRWRFGSAGYIWVALVGPYGNAASDRVRSDQRRAQRACAEP